MKELETTQLGDIRALRRTPTTKDANVNTVDVRNRPSMNALAF
jgi:hypothetical protein